MKRSRAELAGRAMGRAIVEMVDFMDQINTASNFLAGLVEILSARSQTCQDTAKRLEKGRERMQWDD